MISFNLVPSNVRVPGVYMEHDNSIALRGLSVFNTRILVIGGKTSAGTKASGSLNLVNSFEEARQFFGKGSILANMFKALKYNNKYIETWAIPLDDHASGVAATGTVAISGTPTENGTLYLYVAGKLLPIPITTSMTATTIGDAIEAAITADVDLPVTASNSTGTVTITAKNDGETGNDIDLRVNYLGEAQGQKTPAGVTCTITAMASGANNPAVSTAIAALPDEIYDYIVMPYTDTTNMAAMEAELADRWDPTRALEGHLFTFKNATQANLTTYGNARNSEHSTVMGMYNSPTPSYEIAAALVAQVGYKATLDPARPFQRTELKGVLPPPETNRFSFAERNILLYDGIATTTITRDGKVLIERVITTYQTNGVGAVDPSYLDYNTMATLAYIRQDMRSYLSNQYPDFKIANDGTRFSAGQAITTPKRIKASIAGRHTLWEAAGLVENHDQFVDELIVERDTDPNRVNILMIPDLVNQLRVFGIKNSFYL